MDRRQHQRYVNPEYDALSTRPVPKPIRRPLAELFIQMNDIVINDFVSMPLVRVGSKNGVQQHR